MGKLSASLLAAFLLIAGNGCIGFIPTPPSTAGTKLRKKDVTWIVPGKSSRFDVYEKLGVPTNTLAENIDAYSWGVRRGYYVTAFMFAGGTVDEISASHALLVLYDSENIVLKFDFCKLPTRGLHTEFLPRWIKK